MNGWIARSDAEKMAGRCRRTISRWMRAGRWATRWHNGRVWVRTFDVRKAMRRKT